MTQDRKSLAFGGFFGGTVAGLLWAAISWQYGLTMWAIVPVSLTGGCFGWLACDFADAKRSIKTAWKQVVEWEPNTEWWKNTLLTFFGPFSFVSTLFFWATLAVGGSFIDAIVVGLGLGVLFGLIGFLAHIESGGLSGVEKIILKFLLTHLNVVTLPLSIVWYAGKKIPWVLARVPFAVKITGKFLWRAFTLAHSDKRQVCFIGTTLGACAGLFLSSEYEVNLVLGVLVSGVCGSLFSLVWYEVVAIRWLGIKAV